MRNIESLLTEKQPLTYLSEKETKFKEKIRDFGLTHIEHLVFDMDLKAKLDETLIENLFKNGLMSLEIPSVYGGEGRSFFEIILAIEELSKIDPAIAVFVDVQNILFINALLKWGNDDQKNRYLPMLTKDCVGSFSITEKEAGSDTYSLACRADKTDGGYILNGEKHWATNAAEARLFLIFANVYTDEAKGRLTAFILDKIKAKGFAVQDSQEKMGIRASSTCDLTLKNVFIPEGDILGGVGKGMRISLETLTDGRVGIAAQMVGLAESALKVAVDYSKERVQFEQPIAKFQGVHFPLAELAAEIEAARLLVYNAARIKLSCNNFSNFFSAASMAKLFCSNVAEKAASIAVNTIGGNGYMKRNKAEKYYRDAKIGKIYEGTSNMQLQLIAKTYLKIKV